MCHSSCSSPLLRYNDIENQVSGDGPREGAMVVVVMELDRTIVVCVAAFSNLGVLMNSIRFRIKSSPENKNSIFSCVQPNPRLTVLLAIIC
ncbi:hypothetical protein MRB53_004708 [Persea americana]|uniref:Uncharacterized protein n=1 Tax=Persea americana TaxID=3435 RepID=A0ACC2MBD1_PERAE|nr:hypothetical protein MRB53_004708 [Persea americana]